MAAAAIGRVVADEPNFLCRKFSLKSIDCFYSPTNLGTFSAGARILDKLVNSATSRGIATAYGFASSGSMPPIDSGSGGSPISNNAGSCPSIPTSPLSTAECPKAPTNTLIDIEAQREFAQRQNNAARLASGYFNPFNTLLSCFWPTWGVVGSATEADFARLQKEAEETENFEIPLECIEVNFKENFIGGGNQSSVFRGKWNGRKIALKKLNRASEIDIRKLIALDHTNVVKTIGVCTKDICPCIIMEYCEKGNLFKVLQQQTVTKLQFLRWSREIASGMKYLHSLKIVHRDLKSPNVLVDAFDAMKICDFGSLYSWDKTNMPSVVMSVCGTSQWMSPEMLKNEPCNEKVDIWSFGVMLWELLVQEVPYKDMSAMAIMYGVGSDNLRLHVPKTAPRTFSMLVKFCFAKKPRNRPAFGAILDHLDNLADEMANITEDAWQMRKDVWKKEVNTETIRKRQNEFSEKEVEKLAYEQAQELVEKRMHELRHAEEIRMMYLVKMKRAEKMLKQLSRMTFQANEYQEEINRNARAGTAVPCPSGTAAEHQNHPMSIKSVSNSVPELKSVRVQRPTFARYGNGNAVTECYTRGGQHAVLTMEVDVSSGEEEEEEEELFESDAEEAERLNDPLYVDSQYPNIPRSLAPQERLVDGPTQQRSPPTANRSPNSFKPPQNRICTVSSSSSEEELRADPRSRHSYIGAASAQTSFDECKLSSRATSARSSMTFGAYRASDAARLDRNSIANLPAYDAEENPIGLSVCPSCSFRFQRNSPARVSGISADSGVDVERNLSNLTLAEENGNYPLAVGSTPPVDLYRNQQARWSDGRIHRHQGRCRTAATFAPPVVMRNRAATTTTPQRRAAPSSPFTRDSPSRVPSTRLRNRTSSQQRIAAAAKKFGRSTGCLWRSSAAHYGRSSRPQPSQSATARRCRRSQSVHSSEAERYVDPDDDVDDELMPDDEFLPQRHFQRRNVAEAIAEMESSISSKSNRSPKKSNPMEQSTCSTMAASLERSLEMGIADGLSDKESKMREVKSSFRATHRRCASNPTNMIDASKCIQRIPETSTESENDPVYC